MKAKVAERAILAMPLALGLLWADTGWKEKPYTEWTVAEVNEVLGDSPWVRHDQVILNLKQRTVKAVRDAKDQTDTANRPHTLRELRDRRMNSPQESAIDLDRGVLYFEWSSSLAVRQALVRRMQLEHKGNEPAAQQPLGSQTAHYVITVYGSAMSLFAEASEEAVRQRSYLELKHSGRTIPAAKVEFVRLGVLLAAARFYFRRETDGKPAIGMEEKKVKFVYKPEHGTIGAEFDLRQMFRKGKPDL